MIVVDVTRVGDVRRRWRVPARPGLGGDALPPVRSAWEFREVCDDLLPPRPDGTLPDVAVHLSVDTTAWDAAMERLRGALAAAHP